MKSRLIYVLALFVLAACQEKKFGAFVVAGKITNAPEQKVFLEEIPFSGEQPVILDSATIKKSGTFELRAMAREESLYRLVFEKGNSVLFINDENNLRLRLDANNYRKYTVEGSSASNQLHELLEKLYTTDSSFFALQKEKDSLLAFMPSDSLMNALNQRSEQMITRRRSLLNTFIKNTSSPAAICYAIGQYDPQVPATELKQLLDEAARRFPDHSGIGRFQNIIAQQIQPQKPAYPLLNQQAPEIKLPTPAGDSLALSSLKGKYVLVDFWASWCAPCRRENPNVVAAFQKYKDKNFTILGVSLDEDKEKWVQAIQEDGLSWPQISDLKFWNSVAVGLYRFEGIPFNVLVDPNGKIVASDLRGPALDRKLAEVLK